jgi:uncharacterized protein (DUF2164 family)
LIFWRDNLKIHFSDKEKKEIMSKIQYFVKTEFGRDIGIIVSERIFDFFVDELGKKVYNLALDDSKKWMKEKLECLEIDFDQNYKG